MPVRAGGLTRVQLERWFSLHWRERAGKTTTLVDTWKLDPPRRPEEVLRAVKAVCSSHDVLRTRFRIGPHHEPEQLVWPADGFSPPVSLCPDENVAPRLGGADSGADSDPMPWHVAGIVHDGHVRAVVVHAQHIVVDGAGLGEWRRQLLAALDGRTDTSSSTVVHPLDQHTAEHGNGPAGHESPPDVAHTAQAVVPVPHRSAGSYPGYFMSAPAPGLFRDLTRIADLAGSTAPIVGKLATVWALTRLTGRQDVFVASLVHQGRHGSPGLDCRTKIVVEPVRLDPDMTFREALAAVRTSTLEAYLADDSADPVTRLAHIAESLRRRGVGATAPVYYNYLPHTHRDWWNATEGETRFEPVSTDTADSYSTAFFFYQLDDSDMLLRVLADEEVLDRRTAEQVALAIRNLAAGLSDLDSPLRGADALLPTRHPLCAKAMVTSGRWLSPPALTERLDALPGVRSAEVAVEGDRVLADLTLDPGTPVFDVHERLCEFLFHSRNICAPDVYRWRYPNGTSATWSPSADPAPVIECSSSAERALLDAIGTTHERRVTNLALTYVQAGGELVRSPAVVRLVEARGWRGLRREHFDGLLTLRSVARALRRGESRS